MSGQRQHSAGTRRPFLTLPASPFLPARDEDSYKGGRAGSLQVRLPSPRYVYTLNSDNYSATLKGGIGGGVAGLLVGALGVYGATVRYPAFRQLTVPLRAFLITSSGTFAGTDVFFMLPV